MVVLDDLNGIFTLKRRSLESYLSLLVSLDDPDRDPESRRGDPVFTAPDLDPLSLFLEECLSLLESLDVLPYASDEFITYMSDSTFRRLGFRFRFGRPSVNSTRLSLCSSLISRALILDLFLCLDFFNSLLSLLDLLEMEKLLLN